VCSNDELEVVLNMFVSTKVFNQIGPVAYRQWRANSHCRLIHGYAMSFRVEFESETLDVRNWVVDYGSLKSFKDKLEDWFDHTLLVAEDDPEIETFKMLAAKKLAKLTFVERTGCEGLAKFLYDYLEEIWLPDNGYKPRVNVRRVEVRETDNNMAYVTKDN
jgi:6-pyruvoyltetrahydropterin/6-carboxytetrahydropterin synthase